LDDRYIGKEPNFIIMTFFFLTRLKHVPEIKYGVEVTKSLGPPKMEPSHPPCQMRGESIHLPNSIRKTSG